MQRGGCSNSCGANGGDDLQQMATVYGTAEKGRCFRTKVSSSQPQSEQDLEVDKIQFDFGCLPDSLLHEILARLPVQSVFRFKCVSKHWGSLISEPFFSRMYASRKLNSSSLSPFRILYRYVYVSHFQEIVDRLSPDELKSENFSVLCLSDVEDQQQWDQFKVLAASNGLLLCCSLSPLIYCVCSPLTRQWRSLPRPRTSALGNDSIFWGEGLATSVNEENVVTSYKVVRVEWLSMECNYLNFESFSSETGEWRSFRLSCSHPIRLLKRGSPFLFNGVMHWFTCGNWMIAFDPYKNVKECRLIKLPEDRDIVREYKHDGLYCLCDACQGQLRYFEVAPEAMDSFCFSMWIMKDYDKAEWRMEHQATRSKIWSNDPHMSINLLHDTFVPLAYHPFNLDIVYLRCVERSCVVAYDIRTKRLEVSCHPVGIINDLSWRVVIPFVLPIWPTPVPKRARRTNRKRSSDGDALCESNGVNTAY